MSDMVEIDIDFDYCGEVEMILAHDECCEHEDVEFYRNDLLASENARLRELCAEMFEAVKCCCGEWCAETASSCDNNECGWRKRYVALRELGIEVEL